jgi:magnesium transporter
VARFYKKREENRGLAPGSLVFIGEKKTDRMRIRVIDYDGSELQEQTLESIAKGADFSKTQTVTWINVDGLHDTDQIREIGRIFDLHPLLMEDILNTGQRPKMEEFEKYLFIVLKMLRYDEEREMVIAEQLSMVVGATFLLTFQERPGTNCRPSTIEFQKRKFCAASQK